MSLVARIERTHANFKSGNDYHRQFLDAYLPERGLIGDIGGGESRIASFYQNEHRRFVCVDTDKELLDAAKTVRPDIDFRCADAFTLPLANDSLDAYIGLGIFELDNNQGNVAIAEAKRVLKDGGLLYITVPFRNVQRRRLGTQAMWRGVKLPCFAEKEMQHFLSKNGFRVILMRPSSLAHSHRLIGLLSRFFKTALQSEREDAISYKIIGRPLRPFANSLLAIARKSVSRISN